MPEKDSPVTRLEKARNELNRAKTHRFELLGTLSQKRAELALLQRKQKVDRGILERLNEDLHELVTKIEQASQAEGKLVEELQKEKGTTISQRHEDQIARLETAYPIVLLPVRLETRFIHRPGPDNSFGQLWVRIYPDSLQYHTHEPLLTQGEREAGLAYWRQAWSQANEQDAWTSLVAQFGPTRSAWIVRETTPDQYPAQFPHDPSHENPNLAFPDLQIRPDNWCRSPEARGLPDRWEVIATLNKAESESESKVLRTSSNPIREPLCLAPLATSDPVDRNFEKLHDLSGDGLNIPEEARWTFQLEEAEKVGMAVRFDLTKSEFSIGFQSIVVVGVKGSLTPQESSNELKSLIESHHYTGGFGFVAQGTPTNNTKNNPSGFPPADPRGAKSFWVERGALEIGPKSDGARIMKALGLPENLAEHLEGGDRSEQQAAQAMSEALWSATVGYYMEHMWAIIVHAGNGEFKDFFSPSTIQEAREYFVKYVLGRGPFSSFRVGSVPYGLLPTSTWRNWIRKSNAGGVEKELPDSIKKNLQDPNRGGLLKFWLDQVSKVPRVGLTDNANEDLIGALGLEASSHEIWIRKSLGPLSCKGNLSTLVPGGNVKVERAEEILPGLGRGPSARPQPQLHNPLVAILEKIHGFGIVCEPSCRLALFRGSVSIFWWFSY